MSREYNLLSSLLRRALPRPAVLGGPARPGLPPWEAEDLGDYDLLNPSSAARRKQVLLEEGWPRGELPSKVGLREHMQARAALRYKVGLAYHGNAAETGEYLYDPSYAPTGHRTSGPHAEQNVQSQCPTPLRAGLLGPRVVSPHPQGLQGSPQPLTQTSAQRHRTYFLVNNKAVNKPINLSVNAADL